MNILRKERASYPWLSQYLSSYALHGLVIASEEDSRIIPQRINYSLGQGWVKTPAFRRRLQHDTICTWAQTIENPHIPRLE